MLGDWLDVLLPGVVVTLELVAIAAAGSAILAFMVALGCLSRRRWLRWVSLGFVEIFRAIPLLLLLVIVYYALGKYLQTLRIDAFAVAAVVLIVNEGAYTADVYRSALRSIERGQWQAGASIGLSPTQIMRLVIFPQFARIALPPTANMLVYVIKGSALASVITVPELTLKANGLVSETFEPLNVYIVTAGLYLIVTVPLGYLVAFLGRDRDHHVRVTQARRPGRSLMSPRTWTAR